AVVIHPIARLLGRDALGGLIEDALARAQTHAGRSTRRGAWDLRLARTLEALVDEVVAVVVCAVARLLGAREAGLVGVVAIAIQGDDTRPELARRERLSRTVAVAVQVQKPRRDAHAAIVFDPHVRRASRRRLDACREDAEQPGTVTHLD